MPSGSSATEYNLHFRCVQRDPADKRRLCVTLKNEDKNFDIKWIDYGTGVPSENIVRPKHGLTCKQCEKNLKDGEVVWCWCETASGTYEPRTRPPAWFFVHTGCIEEAVTDVDSGVLSAENYEAAQKAFGKTAITSW